jgi:hypothetical protein
MSATHSRHHGTGPNPEEQRLDTRNVFRVSVDRRKCRFAGTSHAGGGTRTPDTRIMIPRCFGSTAPVAEAGGHGRGHIRAAPSQERLRAPGARRVVPGRRLPERRTCGGCRALLVRNSPSGWDLYRTPSAAGTLSCVAPELAAGGGSAFRQEVMRLRVDDRDRPRRILERVLMQSSGYPERLPCGV